MAKIHMPASSTPKDTSSLSTKVALPPPPTVMAPPPGFGSIMVPPIESDVLDVRSPASEHLINLLYPVAGQRQPTYLFESPLLFGSSSDYHTANPFAETVNIPPALFNTYGPSTNDFMFDMFASGDDSALLGSGLLNSILNDDSPRKTMNPFA